MRSRLVLAEAAVAVAGLTRTRLFARLEFGVADPALLFDGLSGGAGLAHRLRQLDVGDDQRLGLDDRVDVAF